jgi:hypothetical protein
MQAYSERLAELVLSSSIAVQAVLGSSPGDAEFIPLLPRPADDRMWAELKARWPGRGLRSVGVIGLVGNTPQLELKEPLEDEQVRALAEAFIAYLDVFLQGSFAAHREAVESAEIAELERMWTLVDPRPDSRLN